MIKKRKQTAMALVAAAAIRQPSTKWTSALSGEDQQYLRSVVGEMRHTPGAAIHTVARGVKLELQLTVSVGTIARTLKELLADGKKKA